MAPSHTLSLNQYGLRACNMQIAVSEERDEYPNVTTEGFLRYPDAGHGCVTYLQLLTGWGM